MFDYQLQNYFCFPKICNFSDKMLVVSWPWRSSINISPILVIVLSYRIKNKAWLSIIYEYSVLKSCTILFLNIIF